LLKLATLPKWIYAKTALIELDMELRASRNGRAIDYDAATMHLFRPCWLTKDLDWLAPRGAILIVMQSVRLVRPTLRIVE
jgi:hypothetical protein